MAAAARVSQRPGNSAGNTTGRVDHPLFAGNMQGGLSNKYAGEPHLKDALDPRCVCDRHVIAVQLKIRGNNCEHAACQGVD